MNHVHRTKQPLIFHTTYPCPNSTQATASYIDSSDNYNFVFDILDPSIHINSLVLNLFATPDTPTNNSGIYSGLYPLNPTPTPLSGIAARYAISLPNAQP